jgi:aerobic-type carbon monoxide dehydrogenase small subunit (CoxS/CutS family)
LRQSSNMQATSDARRQLIVNGEAVDAPARAGMRLLDFLRDILGLTGAKEACGRGECGACTVLLDGRPILSCIALAETVLGEVRTIEGLAQECTALRQAFADHGSFQCGFCTPGQIVRAAALLREPWPDDSREHEAFVRRRMSGNICRCTGYTGIIDAILSVADATRHRLAGMGQA